MLKLFCSQESTHQHQTGEPLQVQGNRRAVPAASRKLRAIEIKDEKNLSRDVGAAVEVIKPLRLFCLADCPIIWELPPLSPAGSTPWQNPADGFI
jgi:hypothetical protein